MHELFEHPEIVSPYGSGEERFKDKAFVQDLSLESFLKAVPFHASNEKESRAYAKKVLVDIGSDIRTAKYRQAVFDDLVPKVLLRNNVRKYVRNLNDLAYKLDAFQKKRDLPKGLAMARLYRDILDNPHDLESANSDAVKTVASYFRELRVSNSSSHLRSLLERIGNSAEMAFRVSLDRNGSPLKMHALELVQKDAGERRGLLSLLEKTLRKKRHEHNLRTTGGLNELGKIIRDYMERQFVPVINAYTPQIQEMIRLLEPLDFYVGFAEYFGALKERNFEICKPTLLPAEERRMFVKNARNPLLLKNRAMEVKNKGISPFQADTENNAGRIVPNGIEYNADENMFVITGPNNGGKTTYAKTIGLIQLLGQKGLFVHAESAEVSFVDGIYTHFVTPDDIAQGEGRYRNELRRMKEIFEKATPYSLVILDEPCGGTRYEEGLRQSLAILDGFHKLGSATYFTTHMHPLTKEVDKGRYPAARNLTVEWKYVDHRMLYTYKMIPGASDKSYGEEIAREMGLMPENIEETLFQKAEEGGYGEILRKRFS